NYFIFRRESAAYCWTDPESVKQLVSDIGAVQVIRGLAPGAEVDTGALPCGEIQKGGLTRPPRNVVRSRDRYSPAVHIPRDAHKPIGMVEGKSAQEHTPGHA